MKKNPWRTTVGALFAAALLAPAAQADVIDFEPANLAGVYLPGDSFSQGSYTLTTLVDFGLIDTAAALGMQAPTGNTTQFYFASNDGRLRLTRSDGLAFNLDGLSAAFVPLDPPSLQITQLWAFGTRSDGSAIGAALGYSTGNGGSFPFTIYVVSGMTDLVSIEFRSCDAGVLSCSVPTQNNGQFAIDNISISVVPEPSAALLMALGLVGLALRQRRAA